MSIPAEQDPEPTRTFAKPHSVELRQWWRFLERAMDCLEVIGGPRESPLGAGVAGGHHHATPTVVIGLERTTAVIFQHGRVMLGPGQCLIIAPGIAHRHACDPGASWFGQGYFARGTDVFFANDRGTYWWGIVRDQGCVDAFWAAVRCGTMRDQGALLRDDLAQLLSVVIAPLQYPDEAVLKMAHCLWERSASGLTMHELVAASGVSKSTAIRRFHAFFGTNMHAEIVAYRLHLARGLLESGETIAAAASHSGWGKVETFSRAWKAAYGYPPGEHLRRSLKS